MSNNKGFEIGLNIPARLLRFRAWGEWDATLREKCQLALSDKILELSAHAHWQIWYVLVDVSQSPAQSEAEIQRLITDQLLAADAQPIRKIAYIFHPAGFQIVRIGEHAGPRQSAFTSLNEAVQWLLQ